MTQDKCEEHITQVVDKCPEGTVHIFDNARVHTRDTSWQNDAWLPKGGYVKKQDIVDWMARHNIIPTREAAKRCILDILREDPDYVDPVASPAAAPASEPASNLNMPATPADVVAVVKANKFTQAELFQICKRYRPEHKYFIDEYIRFCDQHALRTPPYHPEYQAQEPQFHAIKKYIYDGYDGKFETVQQRILDSRLHESVTSNMHAFAMKCVRTAAGHYYRDIHNDNSVMLYVSEGGESDGSPHPSDDSDSDLE